MKTIKKFLVLFWGFTCITGCKTHSASSDNKTAYQSGPFSRGQTLGPIADNQGLLTVINCTTLDEYNKAKTTAWGKEKEEIVKAINDVQSCTFVFSEIYQSRVPAFFNSNRIQAMKDSCHGHCTYRGSPAVLCDDAITAAFSTSLRPAYIESVEGYLGALQHCFQLQTKDQ